MMLSTFKKALSTNFTLKICSFIIGYSWWLLLSQSQIIDYQVTAPICFTNAPQETYIASPETISITLRGTLSALHILMQEPPAVYLDASLINEHHNLLFICEKHLLLPEDIKLVHCKPSQI